MGTGGNKIHLIAKRLNVPIEWLLEGPDGPNVPFLESRVDNAQPWAANSAHRVGEKVSLLDEGYKLLASMSPAGQEQAVAFLRYLAHQHSSPAPPQVGPDTYIPQKKQA